METLTAAQPPAFTVTAFTNGFGDWRAKVEFSHTLSESDSRAEFNLNSQWARIRRNARNAIVREIAIRERTTLETLGMAERRIRASLMPLSVIDSDVNSINTWHSVTLGEYIDRAAVSA